ncbi:MAG: hypothetical protein RIF37_02525 [Rhodospirillaceae bacterium]
MMLSSITPDQLKEILPSMHVALGDWPGAQNAFRKIAASLCRAPHLKADLMAGHADAVSLCDQLGIPIIDGRPEDGFSWNGKEVAIQTETAVLLHEIAHWQICPLARRGVPDFGLGAGPETGLKAEANAAAIVDAATQEREEDLASLLGVLWEAYLGGPAIIAFCEQNWLELYDRPGTVAHFVSVYEDLYSRELIDRKGGPTIALNVV